MRLGPEFKNWFTLRILNNTFNALHLERTEQIVLLISTDWLTDS